jgi:hypothetical protein
MATYSAPMLLSNAACRLNVGQLPSPPYAATASRRSVSIIDKAIPTALADAEVAPVDVQPT